MEVSDYIASTLLAVKLLQPLPGVWCSSKNSNFFLQSSLSSELGCVKFSDIIHRNVLASFITAHFVPNFQRSQSMSINVQKTSGQRALSSWDHWRVIWHLGLARDRETPAAKDRVIVRCVPETGWMCFREQTLYDVMSCTAMLAEQRPPARLTRCKLRSAFTRMGTTQCTLGINSRDLWLPG